MGGWNRRRHVKGHRDRRPPRSLFPPPDYGYEHCSVPFWEREFCSYVGNISWQRFYENKQYVGEYNNLEQWDDSEAFENFQNAKARFWAHYHGQPCDIPLPDPDMYIDKVDQSCKVDPELVADLDKVGLPFDSDNSIASASEADKKASKNQSGNWDLFIEKPAEVNKWESELNSRPNATWGMKDEPSDGWGNSNFGWGDALANPSWRSPSNNYYSLNNWNNSHGGSNNRCRYQSNISGRKRNRGGHFQHRNSRQRNQDDGYQIGGWQDHAEGYRGSGWQDHRGGRNSEWRPVHNRYCQNRSGN